MASVFVRIRHSAMPPVTRSTRNVRPFCRLALSAQTCPGRTVGVSDMLVVPPNHGEEILVLDRVAARELLHKTVMDGLPRGFGRLSVVSDVEGGLSYTQLNAMDGRTFRPYRIVKREDDQLALYGYQALYQARRALDPTKATSSALPTADLINQLIAIGRAEGALLAPRGSELRERIQLIGSALNEKGGKALMLQAHTTVRQSLGPVRARELEAAWDGVGSWLG